MAQKRSSRAKEAADTPADGPATNVPKSGVEPLALPNEPPTQKAAKAPPIVGLFGLTASASNDEIQELVDRQVAADVDASGLTEKYTVLVLRDSISRGSSNRIYRAIRGAPSGKPILIVLDSDGGDVAAAYFIAKLCRQHTEAAFEIAVARRAKSAATLICCGADRLHLGSLSELGPIDPQFGSMPALAMKHSVEHIAELVCRYPGAREMFSDYLAKALPVQSLGFFERAAESSVQYALRLLAARKVSGAPDNNDAIANRLVYSYKDHGFVIDAKEAQAIFGDSVVQIDTDEYKLSNTVFESLDFACFVCDSRLSRRLSYVGDAKQGCWVFRFDPSG